jgi:hypothetical protein
MLPEYSKTDYLIIEPFLQDALQARTLQAAFELGVIDLLVTQGTVASSQLFRNRPCDRPGGRFLVQVLTKAGVFQSSGDQVSLTVTFQKALIYRDLLLTKLQFATLVASDFLTRMPQLLSSADEFMAASTLFELFDYSRCQDVTPENCLLASRWMKLTTMLTRYEAPVCCERFDFGMHRHMLDLGGNSGEFAVRVCQTFPSLQVTVADLPVVCHVGSRHVAEFPESAQIRFQPLHFLQDPFPADIDLITLKSVLHDWPDDLAEAIVRKAYDALPGGGRMLIFERQAWDFSVEAMPYGLLPVLLFFRSYREPQFYQTLLASAGFHNVNVQTIPLEVPFVLISGEKRS